MNKTRRHRKGQNYLVKGWSKQQPGTHQRTVMMKKCGKKCFLGPNKTFPICTKNTCKVNKKGVMAAGDRARQPLVELWKLLRVRRKEIKAQINAKKKHYKEINAKYSKNNYLKKEKPNVP